MLKSWVDGHISDVISLGNRGLNYGDGFFSTALVLNGTIKLQDLHLKRIEDSARRLKFSLSMDDFERDLNLFLKNSEFEYKDQPLILKVIVTRGDAPRGYFWGANKGVHIIFQLSSYQPVEKMQQYRKQGVDVFLCETPISNNKLLAGIKHLNRLEQVLARSEKNPEIFPEGLMFDQNDFLIEGCMSNIFLRKGNEVYTPALESAGVAGVMRAHLIALLKQSAFNFQEVNIKREQLLSMDEMLLTNVNIGMWPIKAIDGLGWKKNQQDSDPDLINSFDVSSLVF